VTVQTTTTIDAPRDAPTDEVLVARALAHEPRAFEMLLRRYNQRVFRTARAILGRDADAEDAAQQAWLSVYVHLAQWSGRGSFSAWALSIVVRTCVRRRSSMRPERELEDDTVLSPASSPEDEAHRREIRAVLERAVDALPETLRTVIVLSDVEGMSGPEIGEALGASDEAIRVRLHRARHRLRETLEGAFEHERRALYPFLGARCDTITHFVMSAIDRREV
jgi:RNA polymerase sigma-70 factor (ECF subfamily)